MPERADRTLVSAGPRTALERWLALVVRYWAFNMSLVHDRGSNWPGFGYSNQEKDTLRAIAARVSEKEYALWLGLVVVFILLIMAGVTTEGLNILLAASGGEKNMANTPMAAFYLELVLDLVVSFSIGFPLAMVPAAALVGRWFSVKDTDLPDRSTASTLFRKLWFQITRAALVCCAVIIPLWIFVPSDSKFWVVSKLIVPLLSPAVAALSAAYYFCRRLRRGERSSSET
jgi:hypothetical protein